MFHSPQKTATLLIACGNTYKHTLKFLTTFEQMHATYANNYSSQYRPIRRVFVHHAPLSQCRNNAIYTHPRPLHQFQALKLKFITRNCRRRVAACLHSVLFGTTEIGIRKSTLVAVCKKTHPHTPSHSVYIPHTNSREHA